MSADMMVISKEDEYTDHDNALFIDETSMGEPWSEFGKWFQSRYCKAPSIMDQIAGISTHSYTKFTKSDLEAVKAALGDMETHKHLNPKKLIDDLTKLVDKHISTENW